VKPENSSRLLLGRAFSPKSGSHFSGMRSKASRQTEALRRSLVKWMRKQRTKHHPRKMTVPFFQNRESYSRLRVGLLLETLPPIKPERSRGEQRVARTARMLLWSSP
jgi:hypothetical protein